MGDTHKANRHIDTFPDKGWLTFGQTVDTYIDMLLLMHDLRAALINPAVTAFAVDPMEHTLTVGSAPKQFIQYLEEDNRPQVTEDVNFENGMGVSIGRLREDTVYDWKFIGLSHNTVRGAAGGAVLCAETLKAQGYIQAK